MQKQRTKSLEASNRKAQELRIEALGQSGNTELENLKESVVKKYLNSS